MPRFSFLLRSFALLAVGFAFAAPHAVQARLLSGHEFGAGFVRTEDLPFGSTSSKPLAPAADPGLVAFASTFEEAGAQQLQGVFAADGFAFPVVQQPAGSPAFVSLQPNVLTQFAVVSDLGTTGLLAHNFLAGASFSELRQGQQIFLVFGGGRTEAYAITQILQYQALQPDSPYSEFIDLQSDARLSASDLYSRIYRSAGNVVLQTCIAAQGDDSWGRLFVIAEPVGA